MEQKIPGVNDKLYCALIRKKREQKKKDYVYTGAHIHIYKQFKPLPTNVIVYHRLSHFPGFYEQNTRRRQIANVDRPAEQEETGTIYEDPNNECKNNQWRRVLLLVVAITVRKVVEIFLKCTYDVKLQIKCDELMLEINFCNVLGAQYSRRSCSWSWIRRSW